MTTNPDRQPFQFSVRMLLAVVTAAGVLLGVFQWLIPQEAPIEFRAFAFIFVAGSLAFAAWASSRAKCHPWKSPEDFVLVKVDAKWLRRVKSPLILGPVATLTGVSLTFAPLALFQFGQAKELGVWQWIGVVACFLVIYLVPGFYLKLAGEVMGELYNSATPPAKTDSGFVGTSPP